MGVSYLGCTTRYGRIRRWAIGLRHRKQSCRSNRGMEMWKTLRISHIPTPPAATTDKPQTTRYTNNLLGTNTGQLSALAKNSELYGAITLSFRLPG